MPPFSDDRKRRFELLVLPHLDAAYNLARWLVGNASEVEDVVQEAHLRAYRYYLSGRRHAPVAAGNRAQLLLDVGAAESVRTNELRRRTADGRRGELLEPLWSGAACDPEALLLHTADSQRVNALMQALPPAYREVLLLREVEELSYRRIAEVVGVPVGTVMSRLVRARATLRRRWFAEDAKESAHEV